ncbi:2-dehydro-3-deoxyphosphooctonate aldolase [Flavobacterium branchiophilum NBRC 15030 = ATCC 35035]|uniref:2-dehydro-3-deoxyphosphooctonate aldolase n=1 Tax=Flavobacterium branchiophilum TaxID=55197 RepID=A0A543G6K2_9FLAO|nr:2-dehydro-3-deoxyphosphooctonate aldolase [Flavobacterium branchiophilum]OXA75624.1 2-dehydro-3-deoxyphosphooctonate aldolase [Flavobacterium branchiophilum NBRC 15030 = ATCC 35035]TQM41716.1 hypothetical protein BC670_2711 [Flavobacterium branchiophilum]GEM55456.1 2-dehydro-3-deoxyphosphooctonate aldolase [Flavobacterium branchiophilum NBRC 15030 = ATCC 35035]
MNKIKYFLLIIINFSILSCISTKSTLKNVDPNAMKPKITKQYVFELTAVSNDDRYGYDKDFPINVFYQNTNNEELNHKRYLNALCGPNGEKISYTKTGICCPFPTKNDKTGAGFISVYEITYEGIKKPLILYLNHYEKGALLAPKGLNIASKFQ